MCYYNWKNQTIRTLLSWNLHTRPLALLMENVAQSLAQDPHFSQLENQSSEAQSRRLYKNNSRGVNSASREGICISYLPDQNHRSTIYQPQPWSMTKREATTRQLLEASAESRYRAAFYHFMQSADMFTNDCVFPRMSKIFLIILSEAHFESSACLQKQRVLLLMFSCRKLQVTMEKAGRTSPALKILAVVEVLGYNMVVRYFCLHKLV